MHQASFTAVVYDDKVKRSGTHWLIRWKFWILVSARRPRRYCQRNASYGPLSENMTSFTKPEVHNMSEEGRATTTISTYTQKFREYWKCRFWRYTSGGQTYRQTDRHTYRHVHRNTSHPYLGEVITCVLRLSLYANQVTRGISWPR